LEIVPKAHEVLTRLRDKGFLLFVVSNQPDVSRGTIDRSVVETINSQLRSELPLDDFFVCYHDDREVCDCRKPRPGLFTRAASHYGVRLRQSYAVGDRWRDIDAGRNAGCKTILIDHHYPEQSPKYPPQASVSSLPEAVEWILNDCEEPERA
jgi:D-glycero-D-manno-heptose 1,7-bisphosphate phosphatase